MGVYLLLSLSLSPTLFIVASLSRAYSLGARGMIVSLQQGGCSQQIYILVAFVFDEQQIL